MLEGRNFDGTAPRAVLGVVLALFGLIAVTVLSNESAAALVDQNRLRVQRFTEVADGVGGLAPGLLDDGDLLSHSMAAIGDLDGDGVPDLAIGAYGDDDGGVDRGAVYIAFQNSDGTIRSSFKISDTAGGFTGGLHDAERFGKEVAAIGDVDGDGVVDLAVGAEAHNGGGFRRGAVYLLFLNTDGSVKAHQEISESDGGFAGILDDSDFFGQSLAGVGDLDSDGVPDLVVGAYFDDDGGLNRGAAYVLFLNNDGTVKAHTKLASGSNGTPLLEDSGFFGYSIAPLGDLDGDGLADIMVGAHFTDLGGPNRGAAYTLFLNADGTVKSSQVIGDATGGFDGVLIDGDTFGTAIDAIGDIDGDGVTEVMIGARRADDGGTDRGAAHILFLQPDGTVNGTVRVSQTSGGFESAPLEDGDQLAEHVTGIGDLDQNGVPDVVVAAFSDDGGGVDRGGYYVLFLEGDSDGDGLFDSAEDLDVDDDANPGTATPWLPIAASFAR